MNPAQQRIRGQIDAFVQAYHAGDVDRLMAVYTDDFIDMSDGEATLSGVHARTETTARLNDTFAKYTGRLTVQVEEIEVAGDRAFDRGSLRLELQPRGPGEPIVVERRFLEIWRREADGEWRVARAMDNSESRKQQSLDFRQ